MAKCYTQFALGLDYALLRAAFLKQGEPNKSINQKRTVLICFGGSDQGNLTKSTLRVVLNFSEFEKIIVVTGAGYKYLHELKPLLKKDERILHYECVDEQRMRLLMEESELVIVPSSGILIEALAVGSKVISGMYVQNQQLIYSRFKNANYFIDAKNFNSKDLNTAIQKSFSIKSMKAIIDGKSHERILNCFNQLVLSERINLRTTNLSDLETTYRWATDEKIRAYSFTRHKIAEEEHLTWYQSKLSNPNCLYYIAELNNKSVGSIRFDLNSDSAITSYLIDPDFQGKGFGQVILRKGVLKLSKLKQQKAQLKKIVGYVVPSNIPSVKAFKRLGFKCIKENNKLKFEKYL